MRISDWSSDVCSSDLVRELPCRVIRQAYQLRRDRSHHADATQERASCPRWGRFPRKPCHRRSLCDTMIAEPVRRVPAERRVAPDRRSCSRVARIVDGPGPPIARSNHSRSEEHTSELQSLMRNSYAVFCLKKKKNPKNTTRHNVK